MESMRWQRKIKMGRVGLVSYYGDWQRVYWRKRGVHRCLGVMDRVHMLKGGMVEVVIMVGIRGDEQS